VLYQGQKPHYAWNRHACRCTNSAWLDQSDGLFRDTLLFAHVQLNREVVGDGAVRTAAISPALHLGLDRVLVWGSGNKSGNESGAGRGPRVRSAFPRLWRR